jgi:hypothetical protein
MKQRERGITSVEFAFVGMLLFILLFGVIEFGRLLYSFSVLAEGARRAARLAAVCPLNDPGITNTAGFANLPNFNANNVQLQYLDVNGNPTGNYTAINYVQVQIVGYQIPLAIPLINPVVNSPAFAVTLPRESLGVSSTTATPCG